MFKANIKKEYVQVFEERLKKIKPQLDQAREMLRETSPNNVFIIGGCAAWLIGRTDTFEEIRVYILNSVGFTCLEYTNPCFKKLFNEYLECNDTQISHSMIYDWSNSNGYHGQVMHHMIGEMTYNGMPSLKLGFTYLNIYDFEKWLSNFAALSVFINLFDLNDIRTSECLCSYESNCTVTQNGCLSHGRVVYPLVFDSLSVEELKEDQIVVIQNLTKDISHVEPWPFPKKNFICPRKLFIDPNLYKNRIMSFCDHLCHKCEKRDKLTKKYVDMWLEKTYKPGGYAYKAAERRFNGIDTYLCHKQYCTC